MKTQDANLVGFDPSATVAATPNPFNRIATTLTRWHKRAKQREELASFNRVLRSDLGLTDADILREARKPFWQE